MVRTSGWPNGSSRQWRKRREAWAPAVAAGEVRCWRCGVLIAPGEEWHLGHPVDRSQGGSDAEAKPEHAGCNLRASGQPRGGRRRTYPGPSREW